MLLIFIGIASVVVAPPPPVSSMTEQAAHLINHADRILSHRIHQGSILPLHYFKDLASFDPEILLHYLQSLPSENLPFDQFRPLAVKYFNNPQMLQAAFEKLESTNPQMVLQYMRSLRLLDHGTRMTLDARSTYHRIIRILQDRLSDNMRHRNPIHLETTGSSESATSQLSTHISFPSDSKISGPKETSPKSEAQPLMPSTHVFDGDGFESVDLSLPISKDADGTMGVEEWVHIPASTRSLPQHIFERILVKYGTDPLLIRSTFRRTIVEDPKALLKTIYDRVLKIADETPDQWTMDLRTLYSDMIKELKESLQHTQSPTDEDYVLLK